LAGEGRRILVDWVSFGSMRREAIAVAVTFDTDFADQGYRMLPG